VKVRASRFGNRLVVGVCVCVCVCVCVRMFLCVYNFFLMNACSLPKIFRRSSFRRGVQSHQVRPQTQQRAASQWPGALQRCVAGSRFFFFFFFLLFLPLSSSSFLSSASSDYCINIIYYNDLGSLRGPGTANFISSISLPRLFVCPCNS
jgi:hypothetical protein